MMANKKILIVDNSAPGRYVAEEILTKHGYEVSFAGNGGKDVAQTRNAGTQHIPALICTAGDQEAGNIQELRQDAKDFVIKPIEGTKLLSKIAALG